MALALSISWLKIAIPLNLNLNQNHCSSYTPLLLSTSGRSNLISRHLISRNKCSRVLCSRQQVKLEDDDLDDDESCELVSGSDLVLGDDDDDDDATDVFRAYLLTPVKNNNGSGLLVLSDVYGFEASSTRDFAYRVACNGYNVLVPDLFRGNPWTRGDQNSSEFEEWVSNQPSERVVKDVKISAKWMMDEFLAAGITKKLGLIGFGFGGGRLIDVLSQDACFSTAVCFYGTQMPTSLDDIKVPVLFISGDSDPLCPIQTLKTYEEGIGRGSRLVIFKGQGHAFAHMPESPEADQVAEEAFVITRNWLHDGLAGSINTSQQLN